MTLSIDERIERLWLRIFKMTYDEWDEEKHPRKKNGQFSKSEGGNEKSINPVIKANRIAISFDQARIQAKVFQGKELVNIDSNLTAIASRNSLDKMLSSKAVKKSVTPQLHSLAVANADKLYENALYGWSKPDRSNDPNIIAIHRLFAVLENDGYQYLVKLTVKEIAREDQLNKLYTIEAVELNEKSPAAQWVDSTVQADGLDPTSIRSARDLMSLANNARENNMNIRINKLLRKRQ